MPKRERLDPNKYTGDTRALAAALRELQDELFGPEKDEGEGTEGGAAKATTTKKRARR